MRQYKSPLLSQLEILFLQKCKRGHTIKNGREEWDSPQTSKLQTAIGHTFPRRKREEFFGMFSLISPVKHYALLQHLHGIGNEKQRLITLKIMNIPMLSRRKMMVHRSKN